MRFIPKLFSFGIVNIYVHIFLIGMKFPFELGTMELFLIVQLSSKSYHNSLIASKYNTLFLMFSVKEFKSQERTIALFLSQRIRRGDAVLGFGQLP